ncbi:MAG: AsmA family protein [Acidobacteriota bacterium]|nr:AsmA family protein [Acidobacteriota bacterium]
MRKLGIAVIAVIVIVVVLVLALPHLIDVNQYRGQIQAELQKRLNRPVQLGDMSLGVFPLRVEVKNVSIGDDPSFHSNVPFAQVGELDVSIKLLPLLAKNIEIESLDLKSARIDLIRNAQGVWNFATAGSGPAAPSTQQAPATQAQPPAKPAVPAESSSAGFTIGELKLTDGQIAITDYQKRQPRAVYDHIDITLKDYAPGQPFTIDATAHLPGAGSQTLQLSGSGGPVNNNDFLSTPFKGKIKLNEVSLSGAEKFLNTAALQGDDAVITGSTDLASAAGKLSANGSLKLDNAVIHGVQVGYPINADFDVTDDLTNDVIQVRQGSLKLGSTPLSLSGTVNTKSNPSVVDLNVKASNASIQEAARLAAAFGVAFSPNTKIAGQLTADIHAQGPTDHLALNGNVSGRNLEVTGKEIVPAVKVPAIDLTMTPQQIQSNNFTATSGGTTLAGQMTISQYTGNSPNVDATLKTVNGKVEELLSIAKAYGVSAAEGMSGSGNITLDVHAVGPIKNTDAMTFNGTGALQNASLKMPSLTQSLNVRIVNMQFTQNSVNLTNMAASLGSTNANGNLSVANFQAPRLTFALSVDKLNVAELEKITGSASPQKAPEKKKAKASWSLLPTTDAAPAPAAKPSLLESTTGTGTIAAGSILYEQTELTNVHSNVTLNHGVIQLNPLTAQIYGGQENGSVTIDTRPNPSTYAVNAKLTGVDANKMLSSISTVKDTLYGTLNANTNITFATPPSGDVVQTVNGMLILNLANGKLMKLDLLNDLSKIGQFSGGGKTQAKGYTPISQMSGTFNLHSGVAQTNDLKAALDVGTMAGTGTINLVTQDLNLHVTAVLDKGFSQSVGGTGVGGYLNTALANKNGELVFPVIITGNMNHPVVAPDVQQIAQMKLKNLLPTAGGLLNGKGGDVGGILSGLMGGQQPQGQPAAKTGQQQQPQNNPLGSALDELLGGGKKKKP